MSADAQSPTPDGAVISYRDALHSAMREAMASNPDTVILGQGITDAEGTFGTTLGLAAEFGPDRLVETPIAEESTMGIAVGAALNGMYPIVVHLRVDFMPVAMNQIVNVVAKYSYTHGGRFKLPMLIRGVIGRSWGQGPQHSQSLQALFAHVPGLTVLMPATAASVRKAYAHAVNEVRSPVISLEHRLLYDRNFRLDAPFEQQRLPFGAAVVRQGSDVTIAAVSYMVQESLLAAEWLAAERGLDCEIIDLNNISDIDLAAIAGSFAKTRRLVVADTGWQPFGVGAEVCRLLQRHHPKLLGCPMAHVALPHTPTPTSHVLENAFYPNVKSLIDAVCGLVGVAGAQADALPPAWTQAGGARTFRGPF